MPTDHEKTINTVFERLSARDFAGVVEFLHDDIEFELAYAPAGFEMPVRGRAAMEKLLADVIGGMFDPFQIGVTTSYPGADGQTVVAEYSSDGTVKHNGNSYQIRYVGIFRFEDDLIRFWREYHDSETATKALA